MLGKIAVLLASVSALRAAYFDQDPCAGLPANECWQTEFRVGGNQMPATWQVDNHGSTSNLIKFGPQGELTLSHTGARNTAPATCGTDASGIEIAMLETTNTIRAMGTAGIDYEIHIQFYVNDTRNQGGSVGILYDFESETRHKHVVLSEQPRCRNVIGYFDSTTPTQLLENPVPTVFGWLPNTLYEVVITRVFIAGARDTTIQIRRWPDGAIQTLRPQRSALETTLLRGAIGVYCANLQSCVFTRAYVHRLDRTEQLKGALECYGCNPGGSTVISVGTATWCRCCGEGNIGCAPFSRSVCVAQSSFCQSTCLQTKYCNATLYPPTPPSPPTMAPPTFAPPTYAPPTVSPPTPTAATKAPSPAPGCEFEARCNKKTAGQCLASSKCVYVSGVCHDYRCGGGSPTNAPPTSAPPTPALVYEQRCQAKSQQQCLASSKCKYVDVSPNVGCHDANWQASSGGSGGGGSSPYANDALCKAKTSGECASSSKCAVVDGVCRDKNYAAKLEFDVKCQAKDLNSCRYSSKCIVVGNECRDADYLA